MAEIFEHEKVKKIAERIGDEQMSFILKEIRRELEIHGVEDFPVDIWLSANPPIVSYTYCSGPQTKVCSFSVTLAESD